MTRVTQCIIAIFKTISRKICAVLSTDLYMVVTYAMVAVIFHNALLGASKFPQSMWRFAVFNQYIVFASFT